MQPLPQKALVLAEIHRRIDRLSETDEGSDVWQSSVVSIVSFAGAWTLAARLMREGLNVSVHEDDDSSDGMGINGDRADVELLISIEPSQRS